MNPELTTCYLGFDLRSPLVASASPMTGEIDALKHLEAHGVGAVVLPSLFEEQIEHEESEMLRLSETGAGSSGEAFDYFPALQAYNSGPEAYLRRVEAARAALSIPVIASLNGATPGGWTHYAKRMEDAGASALELNVYWIPVDPDETGADVEHRYVDLVTSVRATVRVPVCVKVANVFSAPANMARRFEHAGANGLVLFNRLLRPDIDLDTLEMVPRLELSTAHEARVPLQWIGIVRPHTRMSLAASSGVHSGAEALKLLLVGADVVMATSSLLRHGPDHARRILDEITTWMSERGYRSVREMRGSMSHSHAPDPTAYERANYMRALTTYTSDLA